MSYNSKIHVNTTPAGLGTVTGRRIRLEGTSGKLYAKPTYRYKFKHWLDGANNIISTSSPLTIASWADQTITAVFDEITLNHQWFADRDANEVLFLLAQNQGLPSRTPDIYGRDYPARTYYKIPTGIISGPATRTLSDGTVVNTYPCEYGYNHHDGIISNGTYDPALNTKVGTWQRNPLTIDFLTDPISASQLAPMHGGNEYKHLGGDYVRGVTGGTNTAYYQTPFLGALNNPTIGDPVHFPGTDGCLEYSWYKGLSRAYNMELLSLSGMRSMNFWRFYTSYASAPESFSVYDIDNLCFSTELEAQQSTNHYGLQRYNTGANSLNPNSTRLTEYINYNYHLTQSSLQPGYYGPRDTGNVNIGWVTKYQHVPHSGSWIGQYRYTPLRACFVDRNAQCRDMFAAQHHFKPLTFLNLYYPWSYTSGYTPPPGKLEHNWDTDFRSLKNLKALQIYGKPAEFDLTSYGFLKHMPNLRYLLLWYTGSQITTLTDLSGCNSLQSASIHATGLDYSSFPHEPVSLDFRLPSSGLFPDSDDSRNQHPVINHGGIITTT
jgi:hypothetical protein